MSAITMNGSAAAVDGRVGRVGENKTWADLIDDNGDEVNYTNNAVSVLIGSSSTTNQWANIRRGVFLFDPVALPTGAIITGGSLSLRCNSVNNDQYVSELVLANAPVTAYTSLVTADYFLLNAVKTEHSDSRVAVSGLSAGVWAEWELNATALTTFQSLYESGNVFELSVRFDWDFDEVAPTWVSATDCNVIFDGWRAADPTQRPILSIDYRVGAGNATVHLTGQLGDGADTVTADMWAVEVFT